VRAAARRQRGAALIALVAIFLLGGLWWLLAALTPVSRASIEATHNTKLLREAKQAVLGWVAQNAADTTDWNPGKLPCPEALGNFQMPPSTSEGVMQGFCAGAAGTAVGRLPWKSLGLDKPYDANGEVLWYVVSPGWKRPNNTVPEAALGLNSNSSGNLTIDGQANAAVAAIVAPGRRLVTNPIASQTAQGCAARTQTRTTFPPANSNDYIECQNTATPSLRTGVADNASNEVFNDQVVIITAAEVMAAIEGVIAKRIQNTVVPQLSTIYASATWGAGAADPVFPFPAQWNPAGWVAPPVWTPAQSTYKGDSTATEGLLPVTASTCNALTAGRCDANFVQWSVASIVLAPASGANWSSSCAPSTASQIQCDITYSRTCTGLVADAPCSVAPGAVTLTASAANVGMSMRTINSAVITNLSGMTAPTATIGAAGAAAFGVQGTLANSSCNQSTNVFIIFWTCTVGTTVSITVPIGVFADHPFVNPATTDAWYWFIANKWHQVTYYAVSPAHLPTGAHNCTTALPTPNCITVNVSADGTTQTNRKAVLILAGRSVNNSVRPSTNLADYLDSAENTNADRTFQQNRIDRTFNDRVVTVSNY